MIIFFLLIFIIFIILFDSIYNKYNKCIKCSNCSKCRKCIKRNKYYKCNLIENYAVGAINNALSPNKSVNMDGIAFCGGGFKAVSSHFGVMIGLCNATDKNLEEITDNIKVISGNSGGSWIIAMLFYSGHTNSTIKEWIKNQTDNRSTSQILDDLYYRNFKKLYTENNDKHNDFFKDENVVKVIKDLEKNKIFNDTNKVVELIKDILGNLRYYINNDRTWEDMIQNFPLKPINDNKRFQESLENYNKSCKNNCSVYDNRIQKSNKLIIAITTALLKTARVNCFYNDDVVYDILIPDCCESQNNHYGSNINSINKFHLSSLNNKPGSSINCGATIPITISNDTRINLSNFVINIEYYKYTDINKDLKPIRSDKIDLSKFTSEKLSLLEAVSVSSSAAGLLVSFFVLFNIVIDYIVKKIDPKYIKPETIKILLDMAKSISYTGKHSTVGSLLLPNKFNYHNLIKSPLEVTDPYPFRKTSNKKRVNCNIDKLTNNNPVNMIDGGYYDNSSITSLIRSMQKIGKNNINILGISINDDTCLSLSNTIQESGTDNIIPGCDASIFNLFGYQSPLENKTSIFREYSDFECDDNNITNNDFLSKYECLPKNINLNITNTKIFESTRYSHPSYISNNHNITDKYYTTIGPDKVHNIIKYIKWDNLVTIENKYLDINKGTNVTLHIIDIAIPYPKDIVDIWPTPPGIQNKENPDVNINKSKANAINIDKFVKNLCKNNSDFKNLFSTSPPLSSVSKIVADAGLAALQNVNNSCLNANYVQNNYKECCSRSVQSKGIPMSQYKLCKNALKEGIEKGAERWMLSEMGLHH